MSIPSPTSVRFDQFPLAMRQPYQTPEGWIMADAIFARDGILEYYRQDGSVHKELRLPEENEKKHTLYGLVPLTYEHPPKLLTPDTAKNYIRGTTIGETAYDKGGFVRGAIVSYDAQQIESIVRGDAAELSAGYTCVPATNVTLDNAPGTWRGERYDSIQVLKNVNHVCTTIKGRAGENVRVLLDSYGSDPLWDYAYHIDTMASSDPNYQTQKTYFDFSDRKTMSANLNHNTGQFAIVRIDSMEIQLEPSIAHAVNAVITKKDSLEQEKVSWEEEKIKLQEKIDSLIQESKELTEKYDTAQGEADAYESYHNAVDPVIQSLGYYYDSDDETVYKAELDDLDLEDLGLEEDKSDKDNQKKDAGDDNGDLEEEKKDSIGEVIAFFEKAKILKPELVYDVKWDSISHICSGVLADIEPKLDTSDKTPDYLRGWFDSKVIQEIGWNPDENRQDSAEEQKNDQAPFLSELQIIVDAAKTPVNLQSEDGLSEEDKKLDSAWQEPIMKGKK